MDHPRGEGFEQLYRTLSADWLENGPPVCFVEGFPGVGKETLARDLAQAHARDAVFVWMPESESTRIDDLLLDLATELSLIERNQVADAVDRGQPLGLALESVLRDRVLVVIAGFERALAGSGREPTVELRQLLDRIARRPVTKGRVLLLSDESVPRSRWTEPFRIHTLPPPSVEEAVHYLDALLQQTQRQDEVPEDQRADVVKWLGRNPRAIRVFVASLETSGFNELIGLSPETWEAREREVSADLLARLERELLAQTLERLPSEAATVLRQVSVHRRPVGKEAIDVFVPEPTGSPHLRDALVQRFLMEHHQGLYSLHPVVREIELAKLGKTPSLLRQSHSNAAGHYTRHFTGRRVVGPSGRLGAYFVEARFHLVQAGREADLFEISSRFQRHLQNRFGFTSQLPRDPDERDERIAVLSAILSKPGAKGLHYHLARLFQARGRTGDDSRALEQAEHACGPQSPADAWVLRIRLAGAVRGPNAALEAARVGIQRVPAEKNLFALYRVCGELLASSGRADDAINLLRQGIQRVPAEKNLFALYQACGELLASVGRVDDAINLLRQGIQRIPSSQPLYQACGELLASAGRVDDAINLLRQGIQRVPAEMLWALYAAILAIYLRGGRTDDAVAALLEGIREVPRKNRRDRVISSALYLFRALGLRDRIISLLPRLEEERENQQQLGLAEVLLLEMDGKWGEAGRKAQALARVYPASMDIRAQGAFALLAAGESEAAYVFLQTFAGRIQEDAALQWLTAVIDVHRKHPDGVAASVGTHFREVLGDDATPLERLLRTWNGDGTGDSHARVTHFFPCLPPLVTKLPETICFQPLGSPVPMEFTTPTRTTPTRTAPAESHDAGLTFLSVATEWSSHHGGLSTFNRGLCEALVASGHRVLCHIPAVDGEDERNAAASVGVELVTAPPTPGLEGVARLSLRPVLPGDASPDVVIAHDRITGPAGLALVRDHFPDALRCQIVHTAPGEIEPFKLREPGASPRADRRERLQRELARSAGLVAAVGPRLLRETKDLLVGDPVHVLELVPGLSAGPANRPIPEGLRCLVLGRAEDDHLKGIDIAARALGVLEREHGSMYGGVRPKLFVRGAAPGTGDGLRERLRQLAGPSGIDVDVREYTADEEDLTLDILRSSVVLMPSRAEGFGLVGLEAIALDTPVLVSDRSGLGELLGARVPAWAPGCVVRVRDDADLDAKTWAVEIHRILRQREEAFRQARALREAIAAELRWEDTAQQLVRAVRDLIPE